MLQISQVKITSPDAEGIFPRERLFHILDKASARSIIWISGAAGAGKTTLATSWLSGRTHPFLWYRLDRRDADVATFFFYLAEAARKAAPHHTKPLPHFTPEYQLDLPVFARNFFDDLFFRIKKPSFVVFDDLHEVSASPQFQAILQQGLDAIPAGISIILISRSIPPPFLTRFIADGRLATVEPHDLMLTLEEATEVVRIQRRDGLPRSSIQELYELNEGWAAGMMLTISQVDPVENKVSRSAVQHAAIFPYFAEKVLSKADRDERNFLLETSFMPEMTPRMAEELTGLKAAGQILESLHRRCFFTEKLLHPENVYRFHSLFREFLQDQARNILPPHKIVKLQRKAATLVMEEGNVEDAAKLFRMAGDWEGFVRLILGQAQSLVSQGRYSTLEEWITSIPEGVLRSAPWLHFWLGVCRQNVDPVAARKSFEAAFKLFEECGDATGLLLSWSGAADTFFHQWDDFSELDGWIRWLDKRVSHNPTFPSAEIEAAVASSMTCAMTYRSPGNGDIGKWADRALAQSRLIDDPHLRLKVCLFTYNHYLWSGQITRLRVLMEEIRSLARFAESMPLMLIFMKAMEAHQLNLSEASFDEAMLILGEGCSIADNTGIRVVDEILFSTGFFVSMNKGDISRAQEFLEKLAQTLSPTRRVGYGNYHCASAWLALTLGDMSAALVHAEAAVDYTVAIRAHLPELLCRTGYAHVLDEAGDPERATSEFAKADELARSSGSPILQFLHRLLMSSFSFSTGEEVRGIEQLRSALSLGREQHYLDTYGWWRSSTMSMLCARALDNGIEVPYVRELIRKRNLVPQGGHVAIEQWPWALRIYTLGRFSLVLNGEPMVFTGKIQQKPLEMLKALVSLGGRNVSERQLCDFLWPDADPEEAHQSFTVTLHRLRRLLGPEKLIELADGKVTLNPQKCWLDCWAFERLFSETETASGNGIHDEPAEAAIRTARKAIALYKGEFLPGDTERLWSINRRDRLRRKALSLVAIVGRHHEERNEWGDAIDYYLRGIETDELAEELYQRTMHCYHRSGRHGEIGSLYNRCRKALAMQGIKPSLQTIAIFEKTTCEG